MKNLNFIKTVLTSNYQYYLVEMDSNVWFIGIDENIEVDLKSNEILLEYVENISKKYTRNNICLSDNYAPFQQSYISLGNIDNGYAIKGNYKDFLIKALNLGRDKMYSDYWSLLKNHNEDYELNK